MPNSTPEAKKRKERFHRLNRREEIIEDNKNYKNPITDLNQWTLIR
jgi:hypothetical protein